MTADASYISSNTALSIDEDDSVWILDILLLNVDDDDEIA